MKSPPAQSMVPTQDVPDRCMPVTRIGSLRFTGCCESTTGSERVRRPSECPAPRALIFTGQPYAVCDHMRVLSIRTCVGHPQRRSRAIQRPVRQLFVRVGRGDHCGSSARGAQHIGSVMGDFKPPTHLGRSEGSSLRRAVRRPVGAPPVRRCRLSKSTRRMGVPSGRTSLYPQRPGGWEANPGRGEGES